MRECCFKYTLLSGDHDAKTTRKTKKACGANCVLLVLEVGDDLGDVGVHLVKLGVLGGGLPVLAASHRVHNVLSGKKVKINEILLSTQTWMRAK